MLNLINDDCISAMETIESHSIDLVLTDPPYGTTRCKWDSIINLDDMWNALKRITKPNCPIVLTSAQPFTTMLIASNIDMFKYSWIWEKPHAKGFFNANKRPMVAHEDVLVFYRKQPTYNPQKTSGHKLKQALKKKELVSDVYGNSVRDITYSSTERYPRSVQIFKQDTQKSKLHPTQKPLGMMEYFVKTYSNKGDIVLDFTMGSGTTGVAALDTGRKFIGIEKNKDYFEIAEERINLSILSSMNDVIK